MRGSRPNVVDAISPILYYTAIMFGNIEAVAPVMPSATPSEADIGAWEALPRDEQLRRLRAALSHPDCTTATMATMSEILAEARARG